jgi:hypothetical protein
MVFDLQVLHIIQLVIGIIGDHLAASGVGDADGGIGGLVVIDDDAAAGEACSVMADEMGKHHLFIISDGVDGYHVIFNCLILKILDHIK